MSDQPAPNPKPDPVPEPATQPVDTGAQEDAAKEREGGGYD